MNTTGNYRLSVAFGGASTTDNPQNWPKTNKKSTRTSIDQFLYSRPMPTHIQL